MAEPYDRLTYLKFAKLETVIWHHDNLTPVPEPTALFGQPSKNIHKVQSFILIELNATSGNKSQLDLFGLFSLKLKLHALISTKKLTIMGYSIFIKTF